MTVTLKELAAEIGAEIAGEADAAISSVNGLAEAGPGEVSFLANPKYQKQLETTNATAVIVAPGVTAPAGRELNLLKTKDPYYAFCRAVVLLHGYRKHPHVGIHPRANVDPSATIGEGSVLYPGVYVGPRATIGRDCILYPNAVVYDDTVLGDRVILHAGAVIGADGFGYATRKDPDGVVRHHKIPQVGRVEIGDDVEIGANTCIDRAAVGATRVAHGTKIDNLVTIGHGGSIGPHCMIVAQVGIAGSTELGHHVTLAGQVGVTGHLKIGNAATIGAQSGIMMDVPDQSTLVGSPAMPVSHARKVYLLFTKLPELVDRIRQLEQQVEELSAAEGTEGK